MGYKRAVSSGDPNDLPPAAALLRRPANRVRHQVLDELKEAGFDDVLPAHLGVFQHPGPDGQRPGVLAQRNEASKQAMNHLLFQLESGGYITREQHPTDRRTRVVRLTQRGWAAYAVITAATERVDQEWREGLGAKAHNDLRKALVKLEGLLGPAADVS